MGRPPKAPDIKIQRFPFGSTICGHAPGETAEILHNVDVVPPDRLYRPLHPDPLVGTDHWVLPDDWDGVIPLRVRRAVAALEVDCGFWIVGNNKSSVERAAHQVRDDLAPAVGSSNIVNLDEARRAARFLRSPGAL